MFHNGEISDKMDTNNEDNASKGMFIMSQNIFDNKTFFNAYMKLRGEKNYNDLLEQPAINKLLPEIKNKAILDIGCGYGQKSFSFALSGARRVLAIDLSKKMLAAANDSFAHPVIEYKRMDMANLDQLDESFDLIYSSLAFHYVEDFTKLIQTIYKLLNANGQLLFSQEHPISTARNNSKTNFIKDKEGNYQAYTLTNYMASGKREGFWFVDGVIHYHRPISELLTTLITTGFIIEAIVEPTPEDWALHVRGDLHKEFVKPSFLIIKAKKPIL